MATAKAHYGVALAFASELEMRPFVARYRVELGNLSYQTGRNEQAQEHLTAATSMYREMDMRLWLQKAEAAMRQLR